MTPEQKEKRRLYGKAYRQKNKARIDEYNAVYRRENKRLIAEGQKIHYANNKGRISEKHKIYYQENKEQFAKRHNKWRIDNRERNAETNAKWCQNNKDQVKLWRRANPERAKEIGQRRRARLSGVINKFSASDWMAIVARSKHCHWCKAPWTASRRPTHDHVAPLSKGGPNTLENSVAACMGCNRRKKDRLINPNTGQRILL